MGGFYQPAGAVRPRCRGRGPADGYNAPRMRVWPGHLTRSARPGTASASTSRCSPRTPRPWTSACSTRPPTRVKRTVSRCPSGRTTSGTPTCPSQARPALRLPRRTARTRPTRATGSTRQDRPRPVCQGDRPAAALARRQVRLRPGGPGDDLVRDDRTTPAFAPLAAVIDPAFTWGDDRRPRTPWHDTVIYELHVKGFTWRNPRVPAPLRGTYLGLARRRAPAPDDPRRDGRRADAGAPPRQRPPPRRRAA